MKIDARPKRCLEKYKDGYYKDITANHGGKILFWYRVTPFIYYLSWHLSGFHREIDYLAAQKTIKYSCINSINKVYLHKQHIRIVK